MAEPTGNTDDNVKQDDAPPDTPKGVAAFPGILARFARSLEQLRDFVILLTPVLEEQRKKTIKSKGQALSPLLLAFKRIRPDLLPNSNLEELEAVVKKHFSDSVTIEQSGPKSVTVSVVGDQESGVAFGDALEALTRAEMHHAHLHRSSLVSLTSTAEIYFGNLLQAYYQEHPEAADLNERPLTFRQLSTFSSIDAAREYLLETRLEQILRGSLADWLDHLRDRLKLGMSYANEHKDRLIEIFQRRNLLVHAGGIVNHMYLSNTSEKVRGTPKPGHPIHVSQKYLVSAIDLIELVFTLVGLELWKKLSPKDSKRGDSGNNLCFEHLKAQRWNIAQGLSYFISQDKGLPERDQLIGQVNYWQCAKWLDKFITVQGEIKLTDYSAKSPEFELAKLALLDDIDNFCELAPGAVKAEHLEAKALREWPLFRELRKHEQFQRMLEKLDVVPSLPRHDEGEAATAETPIAAEEHPGAEKASPPPNGAKPSDLGQ